MSNDHEDEKSLSLDPREQRRIKLIKSRRSVVHRDINETHKVSKRVLTERDLLPLFRSRFSKLEEDYKVFESLTEELLELIIDAGLEIESSEFEFNAKVKNLYHEIRAIASEVLPQPGKIAEGTSEGQSLALSSARLPKINIPTFDGNLSKFQQFYDVFDSLIHSNATLSNIEKFHYLIASVKGHALSLVSSLPLIESNYIIAWSTLVKQYDNKRLLATHYLEKLLNCTRLPNDSLDQLQGFIETFSENVHALESMGIPNLSEFILFYVASNCLDKNTRKQFELENNSVDFPSIHTLLGFMRKYVNILRSSGTKQTVAVTNSKSLNSMRHTKTSLVAIEGLVKRVSCPLCLSSHRLYQCKKFIAYNIDKRREFVKSKHLCYNCLNTSHTVQKCHSKNTCKCCSRRHHSMVCPSGASNASMPPGTNRDEAKVKVVETNPDPGADEFAGNVTRMLTPEPSNDRQGQPLNSISCASNFPASQNSIVLLGTALALVKTKTGTFSNIRILIDPASQASFITSRCQQTLGLPRKNISVTCFGLAAVPVSTTKGVTSVTLRPRHGGTDIYANAVVIPQITSQQPSVHLHSEMFDKFWSLNLADPTFNKPGEIDFLLGADLYSQIVTEEPIVRNEGLPIAFPSVFGYVVIGSIDGTKLMSQRYSNVISCLVSTECDIDTTLQKFWKVEEIPVKHMISPDDIVAEQQFQSKHFRNHEGRYVVPLLLKENIKAALGHSREQAIRRFMSLERKLNGDDELKREYTSFINEYIGLGHMSPVEWGTGTYVIPHHAVLKTFSNTNSIRVVFDGSCKTTTGHSLNDALYTGPKLQQDISDLILRFRLNPVALVADICKMYRMVLLTKEDRSYQHVIWRPNENTPLQEFELNTVTYGLTSSPFLAIRTIHQLAKDESKHFPFAASILCKDLFVDDLLSGQSSPKLAKELVNQLIGITKAGGFQLRKWASNIPEVLSDVPPDMCKANVCLDPKGDPIIKLLGIYWDAKNDEFSYYLRPVTKVTSKRGILSNIAKLFDPLGWISPVVFWAKYLMQELWKLKVGWDDKLPNRILKSWNTFVAQLPLLGEIKIPRFILGKTGDKMQHSFQLIGFCDASERGYSAVVYLRSGNLSENGSLYLLMSKTRVSPLKPQSIPRLELLGACLLTKLIAHVYDSLANSVHISQLFCFTDSTVLLAWLNTPPHLLKVFVAHRVTQIQECKLGITWQHVNTKNYPADYGSRGILPRQLLELRLWWDGPHWLSESVSNWDVKIVNTEDIEGLPELKSSRTALAATCNIDLSFIDRFSSLLRLQRVLAYCFRFYNITKSKRSMHSRGPLTIKDLNFVMLACIRATQQFHFREEIERLKKNMTCSSRALMRLAPFIDSDGCLRVGGRLTSSHLSYERKHPLLLPKNSSLTILIIDHYHIAYLHAGPTALQFLIRMKYWILSARSIIRHRIYKCITCFKLRAKSCVPQMAALPTPRVQISRTFNHTGVDFAGPFVIKESLRRNAKTHKAYLCIFVCFATKACHLEAVSSLSTEAFLAALDRFMARRGLCAHIYSDCGSNFKGANKYLTGIYKHFMSLIKDESVQTRLLHKNISWNFNPPASPHFGGLWEANIKSAKSHLKRIIGDKALTFEELTTAFSRVEAVLNSRPLTPLSSDVEDLESLTPGHFLIGAPLLAPSEPNLIADKTNILSRWTIVKQIAQHFWNRWSNEYLHQLQSRAKWHVDQPNLSVGDMVVIKGDVTTPLQWSLARVQELHPGTDGRVRVVTVRTVHGSFKRPVAKLCKLPIDR